MSQKDKVKELIGGGLNAYHQRVNNQIERIEKENKKQNHMINVLTKELDNDYLSKTEEGSVISLEHSKEGMVFVDGLEGNTLVNYCVDGTKELTLNGDIDLEGVNVTTTKSAEGGMVDVLCEGNTLVNLAYINSGRIYTRYPMSKNTTYTLIAEFESNKECTLYVEEAGTWAYITSEPNIKVGRNFIKKSVNISSSNYTGLNEFALSNRVNGNYDSSIVFSNRKVVILEGDYTNKEIPPYFEGMKSVGELEGNKIEVLSRNKNEWNGKSQYSNNNANILIREDNECVFEHRQINQGIRIYISKYENKEVTLSYDVELLEGSTLNWGGHNRHSQIAFKVDGVNQSNDYHDGTPINLEINRKYKIDISITIGSFSSNHADAIYLGIEPNRYSSDNPTYTKVKITNFQIIEGRNIQPYVEPKLNKKEILLNEPLRGLPNGIRDKFVKQGGKWYVERNCGSVVLNGSEGWGIASWTEQIISNAYFVSRTQYPNSISSVVVTDKYPCVAEGTISSDDRVGICGSTQSALISIRVDKSQTIEGFKQWLQTNPTAVVCQLATPTYELITDPTLLTYLDTTHISNNSLIPCNMKIKNSGYNAIIKPSTQYTVALDTDKAGTIGINLDGAKVTTTNNVALVTTPSTLTDDSLRLNGKSIKGKNVRLIEGNKSELIPAMFNGMLSCFEDKDNLIDISCSNGDKSSSTQFQLQEPLRGIGNVKDRLVLIEGVPMIERNCGNREYQDGDRLLGSILTDGVSTVFARTEPTYEPLSLELQEIILEGYENGTLFLDTIIPPTVSVRYAGETPIATKLKSTKEFTSYNTDDINNNIIPYVMDMDFRVIELQLASGQEIVGYKSLNNIAKLLERDILSKRYSVSEYRYRIDRYFEIGKITNEEYEQLGEMIHD